MFEGVIGIVIKRNVENGTEIEVETEETQEPPGKAAMFGDEGAVSFIAELDCAGRLRADFLEPGDAAPFLVDAEDGAASGGGLEIVGQGPELLRAFNIAAKKDKAAGLDFLNGRARIGVELGARDAHDQE
jgi:hypothetical protein